MPRGNKILIADPHDKLFVDVVTARGEIGVFGLPGLGEQRPDRGVHG
jgi:hypothetical protein